MTDDLKAAIDQARDSIEQLQLRIKEAKAGVSPPGWTCIETEDAEAVLALAKREYQHLSYGPGFAYREAKGLAEWLWRKHYQAEAPGWKPLDTTAGIISQIDNMVCTLVLPTPSLTGEDLERSAAAFMAALGWGYTEEYAMRAALQAIGIKIGEETP